MVLAPHQDDETIGCGLLLAEKARRGTPVAVAVATDGSGGWFSSKPRPTPHEVVEIRHDEWHRALDILDVPKPLRFELAFPDGALSDHEAELADRICTLLTSVRPSQVFVTGSADPHRDHQTLARAARHALHQMETSEPAAGHDDVVRGPRPQLFTYRVYPVHGLWPDGLPSHVSFGAITVRFVRSTLGLLRRRPLRLRCPVAVPQKTAAIGSFASQRRLLDGELRYVWRPEVELYWPIDEHGPNGLADPVGPAN